ncbi:Protein FMP32, mitochondrial [Leucoagaricus sp. SymC.cos]|nr:Protein FMP32, mitochondrial [Leucoagaricus sp. SymC.cos]KXN81522.1 Protein FMP32, mitochondrial [Leucoagaricus sp. SymC.cos]
MASLSSIRNFPISQRRIINSLLTTSLISNRTSVLPLSFHSSASAPISIQHQHHRSYHARRSPSTRSFTSTPKHSDFHFDTHHFVQRLEREGLKREQAEGIMTAMAEVIDEAIRNMTSNMVTKAEQEKHQYTQQVDFAQSKSELQLMAKNDLAMIKAENERLVTEVERLKQRLREEITRTQAGVRLDLNLEKGRMREESSKQELKIKEVDTRIEQEIANLKTNIQASKATTLQYLVGFVTGCSALLMAYLRFRV